MYEELIEIERGFWQAAGDVGFYRHRFAADGVMAFPSGILSREEVLAAVAAAAPWEDFTIDEPRIAAVGEEAAVLVYTTSARRGDGDPYRAVVSSVYARRDGIWKLVHHQQTPLRET